MITFSARLFMVVRKATVLCKLILYPAVLLEWFVISRGFLVEFWGSLTYDIMPSTNGDSLTSFPICIPLISFSCFLVSETALRTVLKKSRDSDCPIFFLFSVGPLQVFLY